MWRSYLALAHRAAPLAALLALALYLPLRTRYKKKHALRPTFGHEACLCLLVAYGAAALALVWSPGSLYLQSPIGALATRLQTGEGINLVPFFTLRQVWAGKHLGDILNLCTNVLLFAPLGYLLPFLFPRWRRWYKTIPAGLGASAFIEGVQLFTGRSVDVDDVLLNTLGAAVGYGVWRAAHRQVKGHRGDKLLLGCFGALCIAISPFLAITYAWAPAFAPVPPTYPLADIQPGEVTELWIISTTPAAARSFWHIDGAAAIYENREVFSILEGGELMAKPDMALFVNRGGTTEVYNYLARHKPEFGTLQPGQVSYLYYLQNRLACETVEEGQYHTVLTDETGKLWLFVHTGDSKNPATTRQIMGDNGVGIGGCDYTVEYLTHTIVEITLTRNGERSDLSTGVLARRWWFDINTATLTQMEVVREEGDADI